jgi:hypothetical protein
MQPNNLQHTPTWSKLSPPGYRHLHIRTQTLVPSWNRSLNVMATAWRSDLYHLLPIRYANTEDRLTFSASKCFYVIFDPPCAFYSLSFRSCCSDVLMAALKRTQSTSTNTTAKPQQVSYSLQFVSACVIWCSEHSAVSQQFVAHLEIRR